MDLPGLRGKGGAMTRSISLQMLGQEICVAIARKESCPRKGCGAQLQPSAREASVIWTCPAGHYEVRETNGGMRADWLASKRG